MLAMKFARVRGTIDQEKFAGMLTDLRCLPDQIELLLGQKEKIQHFANRYVGARDIFFIGRGIDYAISLEGSLKLKEISYIHSEAYAVKPYIGGFFLLGKPCSHASSFLRLCYAIGVFFGCFPRLLTWGKLRF